MFLSLLLRKYSLPLALPTGWALQGQLTKNSGFQGSSPSNIRSSMEGWICSWEAMTITDTLWLRQEASKILNRGGDISWVILAAVLRIDSRREIAVEVERGGWILDIVSSIGFADDLHVGCEREISRWLPHFDLNNWMETNLQRGEKTKQEHTSKGKGPSEALSETH